MKNLEINIVKSVIENLKGSAKSGWRSGDFEEWADYAKKMKSSIKNNVNVLETLLEEKEEEEL
jgi:hypothetical protein